MKNFDCYSKMQGLADNSTQWEKKYSDGQTARAVVDNRNWCRMMVVKAFEAQETGLVIGCFSREDLDRF